MIKYYELRNNRVLVLAPKRLRDNWTIYTRNDVRNVLVQDRFNYDVLNHTDLSRTSGMSGDIDLAGMNWGNYDLVVIDESHNFRNNVPTKGHMTRYQRLMNDIIKAGVKTKVLMLSATPVNNRMNDIKNQIAFITEGNDIALQDMGISSIENVLRLAQTVFNQWNKTQNIDKSTNSFVSLMSARNPSYFRLLDILTIARSRKHISKYYDSSEIGTFPKRLAPINLYPGIDREKEFPDIKISIQKSEDSPWPFIHPWLILNCQNLLNMPADMIRRSIRGNPDLPSWTGSSSLSVSFEWAC